MDIYKRYNYKEKKVRLDNSIYDALFPKGHSKVKGLIYKEWDANASDPYANIINSQTICYILWKKKQEWEKFYEGPSGDFKINDCKFKYGGIFPILFALESEKTRKKYLREEEINRLKKEMEYKTNRLEELLNQK